MNIKRGLQAVTERLRGGTGLIHEPDSRDLISDIGISFAPYTPQYDALSYYRFEYNQNPLNICTQAGSILALSEQTSVRFSVKANTRKVKRNGKISGNGFASQRAPMDVIVDDGVIPVDFMPDEVQDWGTFSRWDDNTQTLYTREAVFAGLCKYKKLTSEGAIWEALDRGYVPIIASKWYYGCNRPVSPGYFLRFTGGYIGGHQYRITGYRKNGSDFQNGQTFGKLYGENGKAYNEDLLSSPYYDVYIIDFDGSPLPPMETLLPLFLQQHEGLMVKAHDHFGQPECYVIENGQKRWVSGADEMRTFQKLLSTVGLTRVNREVLRAVPLGEPYPLT